MRKIGLLILIGLFALACSPKMAKTGNTGAAHAASKSKKSYKLLTVAFYNLENMFDTINDPTKNDEASPMMEIPKERRGKVYRKKISNMAKVLSEIGSKVAKNSPAVIGVCEVENSTVLEDIVNDPHLRSKNYGFIHYPGPDERSIDVALLYQKKLFKPLSSSAHHVILYRQDEPSKRDYTRDELLVSGILDGDTIHFIVNHWPSRYGGEKRSRPSRIKAAELAKHLIDSIKAIDPYAKIIMMGDLNDDPFNASIKDVLKPKANKKNVKTDDLFDPMINMLEKQGLGTLGYRDHWDLFDQMIMTGSLLSGDYSGYQYYRAGIYNPSYLITQHGRYRGYPFRSFDDGHFTGGYSDHLPVYVYLVKQVKE